MLALPPFALSLSKAPIVLSLKDTDRPEPVEGPELVEGPSVNQNHSSCISRHTASRVLTTFSQASTNGSS
jgi:hypothetical protein